MTEVDKNDDLGDEYRSILDTLCGSGGDKWQSPGLVGIAGTIFILYL